MNTRPVNVGQAERVAAGILAVAILTGAVQVRHPLRFFVAGCLVYRALRGHCFGYEWLGVSTCKIPPRR